MTALNNFKEKKSLKINLEFIFPVKCKLILKFIQTFLISLSLSDSGAFRSNLRKWIYCENTSGDVCSWGKLKCHHAKPIWSHTTSLSIIINVLDSILDLQNWYPLSSSRTLSYTFHLINGREIYLFSHCQSSLSTEAAYGSVHSINKISSERKKKPQNMKISSNQYGNLFLAV